MLDQTQQRYAVGTWQALVKCQLQSVRRLVRDLTVAEELTHAIALNARSVGVELAEGKKLEFKLLRGEGSEEVYRLIGRLDGSEAELSYLLGSEVRQACLAGRMPQPPYEWRKEEPDVFSACDPTSPAKQTTS